MKPVIQCQEEVSRDKRSYKNDKTRPESFPHKDEEETHQCKYSAQYLIKHIELYVCKTHASGIDKKQLMKLRKR